MKSILTVLFVAIFTLSSSAQDNSMKKTDLKTQMDKVSYSIGQDIGKNFRQQGIEVSIQAMLQGLKDAFNKTSLLTDEEMKSVLMAFQQEMMAKKGAINKAAGEANLKAGTEFLTANKMKKGVITLPSGLQYKIIKKGNGAKPVQTDKVIVHYTGKFVDGKVFDSSVERNEPVTFPVLGVIKGWTEALQLMSVGDKWELYIPYDLAYGANGKAPVIGPYQTLLFDIELLDIAK